jgi:hypothetical protein
VIFAPSEDTDPNRTAKDNIRHNAAKDYASCGVERRFRGTNSLPCYLGDPLLSSSARQLTDVQSQVAVEDRPYPNIQKPTDAILKVSSTALCGSDLHFYRGHLKCPPDFICGHEFVGEIVEKGDDVKKFNIGDKVCQLQGLRLGRRSVEEDQAEGDVERMVFASDKSADCSCQVVVPFYTACGECFYCVRGQASRCSKGMLPLFFAALPSD